MKTHQKSDPKMEPKSIKKHSKKDAKKETKKEGLKTLQPLTGTVRSFAKPNHFKRHPSE